jgi:hypothetical protein
MNFIKLKLKVRRIIKIRLEEICPERKQIIPKTTNGKIPENESLASLLF